MLRTSAETISSAQHCLLFRHDHADRVRQLARMGMIIGGSVLASLAFTYWRHQSATGAAPLTTLAYAGLIGIAGLALWFCIYSWRLTREFVVHFEVWPRSNLAIVRTIGWWRPQVEMVPWRDFGGSTPLTTDSPAHRADPWVHIRLRSGRRLIFDQQGGHAPESWAALSRFLQKRSVPVSRDDVMGSSNAVIGSTA